MTKYYLKFDTMKHIMQTPVNFTIEDALHIICRAEEIACMYICNDYVSSGTWKFTWGSDIVIYWNIKGYSSDAMRRNF